MLATQWAFGERGFDPEQVSDNVEITVGMKVHIFIPIQRLRKDESLSERRYRTMVDGIVTKILPKSYRVTWQFSEGVGRTNNEPSGTKVCKRDELFERHY